MSSSIYSRWRRARSRCFDPERHSAGPLSYPRWWWGIGSCPIGDSDLGVGLGMHFVEADEEGCEPRLTVELRPGRSRPVAEIPTCRNDEYRWCGKRGLNSLFSSLPRG